MNTEKNGSAGREPGRATKSTTGSSYSASKQPDKARQARRGNGSEHPGETEAIQFLEEMHPNGMWALTAIPPDGVPTAATVETRKAALDFIRTHNGERNIYYAVNPLRAAMNKKAKKTDVAAIEFIYGDLDPKEDETPEDAKERYLKALEDEPETSALVDSGNGLQGLWRLDQPIPLELDEEGRLTSEAEEVIADVEGRAKALMERLGAKAGTQNIDRILRLPGTINLPNAVKLRAGRMECTARLLHLNGAVHPLDAFPLPEPEKRASKTEGSQRRDTSDDDGDELWRTIRDGGGDRHGSTRSHAVWYVVNMMLRRSYAEDKIIDVLLDEANGISEHIYDQPKPQAYAERQVVHAKKKIGLSVDAHGKPFLGQDNIRIALLKMGVTLRYDQFSDHNIIEGLEDFGPVLDDAAMNRLRLTIDQRFKFLPSKDMFYSVVTDAARLNKFHPVLDYLDSLTWDGVPRIDNWLTTYAGVKDTEYTRAVGALTLTAAVRRVRKPGCKFDEMLVFEGEKQGKNKSTAIAILAVREAWFHDDLPLNAEGKRVIEAVRGRWLVEAAELSGYTKADIEHMKSFLSRQIDRARMAYDRLVTEVPRQFIVIGTTNKLEWMRDTSGNRRYWPVMVRGFKLKDLRRDRDQLWAEAAAREATGESIRLPRELWPVAAEEQTKRLTQDPFLPALQDALVDRQGKISSESVWAILDARPAQRGQEQARRVSEAMRALGWKRPNSASIVKIEGKPVVGWVKGDQPWKINLFRREEGRLKEW